jgi:hypothetical protein|tara:strand:- start:3511 stop:3783 length:273 start_codon:yes stop_codon:yes gene_type:complete
MGKQKLSAKAAATKKARDIAYAKGMAWNGKSTAKFNRKAKKAENQRIGQNSTSDIHHVDGKVGNTKRVSISNNRDTFKNGDRKRKKTTKK